MKSKILNEYKYIEKIITSMQEELKTLGEMKGSIKSQSYDRIGSSSSWLSNPTEDRAIAMAELEKELDKSITRFISLKTLIFKTLNKMEKKSHIQILQLYYIKNMTFENVAIEMDISYQWCWKLHKMAIKEFEEKFNEKNEIVDIN